MTAGESKRENEVVREGERESVCLREGRRERQGTCVVSTYTAHCCVSEQSEKRYKGEGSSRQERRRAV